MASINDVNAYSQVSQAYATSKTASAKTSGTNASAKTATAKAWSSIDSASSLVPTKTEYGYTIGNVQLSEKAAKYYEQLKSKFHNMEFIAVSSDVKDQVQANAGSYGNASKMVVLLDADKIEKMAEDENYRKKYESIIANASAKLTQAKSSMTSSGASVSNFGMSVDSNGNEKFFAVVKESLDRQKERIEKKAEENKAEQKEKAKEAAEARDEKRAEKAKTEEERLQELIDTFNENSQYDYNIIESDSMEGLLGKVSEYAYNMASSSAMTQAELALGNSIDFKG